MFSLHDNTRIMLCRAAFVALCVVRSSIICVVAPARRHVLPNAAIPALLPNRKAEADPVWLHITKIPKGPGSAKGTPAFFFVPIASSNLRN